MKLTELEKSIAVGHQRMTELARLVKPSAEAPYDTGAEIAHRQVNLDVGALQERRAKLLILGLSEEHAPEPPLPPAQPTTSTDDRKREREYTIKLMSRALGPVLLKWMEQSLAPLLSRLAELESQSALTKAATEDLKVRAGALAAEQIRFAGIWRDDVYAKNVLTIHSGGLWISTVDSARGKPGQSSGWQLAVKSGSVR
jgi:hypothetical protein